MERSNLAESFIKDDNVPLVYRSLMLEIPLLDQMRKTVSEYDISNKWLQYTGAKVEDL